MPPLLDQLATYACFGLGSYRTFKALKVKATAGARDFNLLKLWCILGGLQAFEEYFEVLLAWVPFYYSFKLVALAILMAPESSFVPLAFQHLVIPAIEGLHHTLNHFVLPNVLEFVVSLPWLLLVSLFPAVDPLHDPVALAEGRPRRYGDMRGDILSSPCAISQHVSSTKKLQQFARLHQLSQPPPRLPPPNFTEQSFDSLEGGRERGHIYRADGTVGASAQSVEDSGRSKDAILQRSESSVEVDLAHEDDDSVVIDRASTLGLITVQQDIPLAVEEEGEAHNQLPSFMEPSTPIPSISIQTKDVGLSPVPIVISTPDSLSKTLRRMLTGHSDIRLRDHLFDLRTRMPPLPQDVATPAVRPTQKRRQQQLPRRPSVTKVNAGRPPSPSSRARSSSRNRTVGSGRPRSKSRDVSGEQPDVLQEPRRRSDEPPNSIKPVSIIDEKRAEKVLNGLRRGRSRRDSGGGDEKDAQNVGGGGGPSSRLQSLHSWKRGKALSQQQALSKEEEKKESSSFDDIPPESKRGDESDLVHVSPLNSPMSSKDEGPSSSGSGNNSFWKGSGMSLSRRKLGAAAATKK